MSEWIKCDKCNKTTKAESSGEKRYKIGVDGFDGYSTFHLCEWCLRSFYLDYLGWVWNDDERQYVPQESEKINCKTTKCENCQNHNYCDYEPQESEVTDADSD